MNDIKVTIEKHPQTQVLSGDFLVVGVVRNTERGRQLSIVTIGDANAYEASMLGCQLAAKLIEPFDTLDRENTSDADGVPADTSTCFLRRV